MGVIAYRDALAIQLERLAAVQDGAQETLFLLEHKPVITLGTGGGMDNLHVSEDFLRQRGIDLVPIRRGGNITCHFPGQLVAYPVFRIERRRGGIKAFFHDMEEVVIRALARVGVAAGRWEGRPGVWVENRKVCSMGIGVKRWVTYHGLALNVGRDVSLFDLITLCGLSDARATSVHAELERTRPQSALPDMQEMKNVLAEEFRTVFADSAVAAGEPAQ
nr:lipoyl(octanoyl) transferase LipB [Desulfobaculum xiamenense]